MSKKYLGDTLDIHMGGIEHIPIHHTNEIAQSESANGARFVNYWMHNAHLVVDNEKMAKSQGTSFSLSEITEKGFSPIVLRYFYLQAQYRSAQNFTWDALQAAQNGLDNIYNVVESLGKEMGDVDKRFKDKFIKALSDDFNTPVALSIFLDMLKSKISNQDKLATALDFDKVLGLKLDDIINAAPIAIPGEIQKIVDERSAARKDKDFKKSDELRDLLKEKGYSVADTKDGQQVKKI
jgi:cysteinyl-tRNA synthetase